MACTKCNTSNKCGCKDVPFNMPLTYSNNPTVCPVDSEKCTEVFDMGCICYQGPDIVELNILQGSRLDEVLQKLILAITDPGCATFSNPTACQSAINILIENITTTSFQISWDAVTSATGYSVEYKASTSLTWLVRPTVVTLTDTLVGLTPDTIYDIRINTICALGTCYSLNLRIKTLS